MLIAGTAAAVEVIHQDGNVSQILELDVDGELFDITFVYEPAETAYAGDQFDFETLDDAIAVVAAITVALNPEFTDEGTEFPSVGPDADTTFMVAHQRIGEDVTIVLGFLAIMTKQNILRWLPDDVGQDISVTSINTYVKAIRSVPVDSTSWGHIKALYE